MNNKFELSISEAGFIKYCCDTDYGYTDVAQIDIIVYLLKKILKKRGFLLIHKDELEEVIGAILIETLPIEIINYGGVEECNNLLCGECGTKTDVPGLLQHIIHQLESREAL